MKAIVFSRGYSDFYQIFEYDEEKHEDFIYENKEKDTSLELYYQGTRIFGGSDKYFAIFNIDSILGLACDKEYNVTVEENKKDKKISIVDDNGDLIVFNVWRKPYIYSEKDTIEIIDRVVI